MEKINIKFKNYFFASYLIFIIFFSLIDSSICINRCTIKLLMDDCFRKIDVNFVTQYNDTTNCDYYTRRLEFDDMECKYGDLIEFVLHDDGKNSGEGSWGFCYIEGDIQINEYLVSTNNSDLWECYNCHYSVDGKRYKFDNGRLHCGDNGGKEVDYKYAFQVPPNITELRKKGIVVSEPFYKIVNHTVYMKNQETFTINLTDISIAYWELKKNTSKYSVTKKSINTNDIYFKISIPNSKKGKFFYIDKEGEKAELTGETFFSGDSLIYEASEKDFNYMDELTISTAAFYDDVTKRVQTSLDYKFNYCVMDNTCMETWETRIDNYTSDCKFKECDHCPNEQGFIDDDRSKCVNLSDYIYFPSEEDDEMFYSCKNGCSACGSKPEGDKHNCDSCLNSYPYSYEYAKSGSAKKSCFNVNCEETGSFLYHNYKNDYNCLTGCDKDFYTSKIDPYTCYKKCPKGKGYLNDDKEECVSLEDKIIYKSADDNYMYYTCYNTCDSCNSKGTQEFHNCLGCLPEFPFFFKYKAKDGSLKKSCFYENCEFVSSEYSYHLVNNSYECLKECPSNSYSVENDKYTCYPICESGFGYINDNKTAGCQRLEGKVLFKSSKDPFMFYTCYETCGQCKDKGYENIQSCDECLETSPYFFKYKKWDGTYKKNCYSVPCNQTSHKYYIKGNETQCFDYCPGSTSSSTNNEDPYSCYPNSDSENGVHNYQGLFWGSVIFFSVSIIILLITAYLIITYRKNRKEIAENKQLNELEKIKEFDSDNFTVEDFSSYSSKDESNITPLKKRFIVDN